MERQVWQSIDTEAMRRWSEVLLSRTTLMAARFKALHENARLRLAEAKQKRQLRDQVEAVIKEAGRQKVEKDSRDQLVQEAAASALDRRPAGTATAACAPTSDVT